MIKLKRETVDVERRAGSVPKMVTTTSEDRYLKRKCLRNCHTSAPDLKVEFANACDVNIGARTVQSRLMKCDLPVYRSKKRPLLTKQNNPEATLFGRKTCFMDKGSVGLGYFFG